MYRCLYVWGQPVTTLGSCLFFLMAGELVSKLLSYAFFIISLRGLLFFFLFYFIVVPPLFIYFLTAFVFWLKLYMHVGSWKFITFEGGVWNFCGLPSPANWNHKHYLKKRKGWSKVGLLAIRWGKNKCGSATLFDLLIGSFRIPGKSALFEFRLRGELIFLNFFITNTMIHLKRMLLWCVSLHVSQVHINNYM